MAAMTRVEALQKVVWMCDRWMQAQLIAAECLLIRLGATRQELEFALGPNGFARRMFKRRVGGASKSEVRDFHYREPEDT
jgi:hypothetical protein